MQWNRREFLTTSSLALAGAFRSGPLFGQEKPLVGTFTELRGGVGTFLCSGGTTTWAISPGCRPHCRQPDDGFCAGLARRSENAHQAQPD